MNEEEKVGLSEPMIRVMTPVCMACRHASVVYLTREEFKAVAEKRMSIREALPDRTAEFRTLFASGMHGECLRRGVGR